METHIANLTFPLASAAVPLTAIDEMELFQVCLQRLLNVAAALALQLYNKGIFDADKLHTRFNSLRSSGVLLGSGSGSSSDANVNSSSGGSGGSAAVRNETLNFLKYIVPVDTEGRYSSELFAWFVGVIERRHEYSFQAICEALEGITPLLRTRPAEACEVTI